MKRSLLALFILCLSLCSSLQAEHFFLPTRKPGYFFLPSRTLFYFQPHLFVQMYSYPKFFVYSPFGYWSYGVPLSYVPRRLGVYRVILNRPSGTEVVRANTAHLIFKVVPSKALIYVDGKLIGSARNLATERDRYMLTDGTHEVRIEYPGYEPFQSEMEIVPNRTLYLDIELRPTAPRR